MRKRIRRQAAEAPKGSQESLRCPTKSWWQLWLCTPSRNVSTVLFWKTMKGIYESSHLVANSELLYIEKRSILRPFRINLWRFCKVAFTTTKEMGWDGRPVCQNKLHWGSLGHKSHTPCRQTQPSSLTRSESGQFLGLSNLTQNSTLTSVGSQDKKLIYHDIMILKSTTTIRCTIYIHLCWNLTHLQNLQKEN
jgi:hypothetical protein